MIILEESLIATEIELPEPLFRRLQALLDRHPSESINSDDQSLLSMQAYLQHLIPDPSVGYLFPHRAAINAFGQKEHQLLKHRSSLIKDQDWFKIKGTDHILRVYYSLSGLLKLADLIGTPHAQQFKHALIQHLQPGGAIVPAQPTALYAYPVTEETSERDFEPALTPEDPAYRLAQYLEPGVSRVFKQEMAARSSPSPSGSLSPQETAALIFQAQQIVSSQIFQAQRLATITQRFPPEIQVKVNPWHRWGSWLDEQDALAFSFVAAILIGIMGLFGWFLFAITVRQPPAPTPGYSNQSWR